MYLTHFGRVQDVSHMVSSLKTAIGQFVNIAETHANDENRTRLIEAGISDWLLDGLREHGVTLPEQQIREIVQNDMVLNTQGIEFWLDHRK